MCKKWNNKYNMIYIIISDMVLNFERSVSYFIVIGFYKLS